MYTDLPYSNSIDTRKLGRLFDNMSESYKLFWFQAIVNKVYEGELLLSFDELINEMISDGWYMVSEYKLNLGPSDTLEKVIETAFQRSKLKSNEKKNKVIQTLKKSRDKELIKMKKTLTLNVPYRLQAPFLDDVKGNVWNRKGLSDVINDHDDLLYYFDNIDGLNSIIRINESFAEYVKSNYEIINGWIRYKMVEYLQKRNPAVPGIVNKIDPPQTRNLNHVIDYWKEIINETKVYDIYSDKDLSNISISIDHFVPWSYVAHDELWNLTPTTRNINSSKSNNLPDWDKYFTKLSKLQYRAYRISFENHVIGKLFQNCLDEYVNDINIRHNLYKPDQEEYEFTNRLEEVIKPVYVAATNLGFNKWVGPRE